MLPTSNIVPTVMLREVSGSNSLDPNFIEAEWVGGRVPLFTRFPFSSKADVTSTRFACPTVGTRNPVLSEPRNAKLSVHCQRAASLPFKVSPKSS